MFTVRNVNPLLGISLDTSKKPKNQGKLEKYVRVEFSEKPMCGKYHVPTSNFPQKLVNGLIKSEINVFLLGTEEN